jgi:ectoine hydroxylase-related dioxygenase (phytanoyl-CoA dioxygenase family)
MIRDFHEQGFVRVNQVFTPAEMDQIDAGFERLHDLSQQVAKTRQGPQAVHEGSRFTFNTHDSHVRHISYCGNAEPILLAFGRDPRLLAIASALLGSNEMDHLINQAHYKRPGSAVAFDWHQDCQHRGLATGGFEDVNGKGSYVQIALAVDDATADNGPLEFIAGSNKLGDLGPNPGTKADLSRRVAPLIKRGDVAAFGPYTIHGSEANLSDKPRRVFINGFAYPGANHKDYGLPHSGERLSIETA